MKLSIARMSCFAFPVACVVAAAACGERGRDDESEIFEATDQSSSPVSVNGIVAQRGTVKRGSLEQGATCGLRMGTSSPDDVRDHLGEPSWEGSEGSTLVYAFSYEDGGFVVFGFVDATLDTVNGSKVVLCVAWR